MAASSAKLQLISCVSSRWISPVIGASAIDPDGSLLDYDYREVKVTKTIMENARHVILAADSTKFERTAPVRVGHLSQVTTFVTDRCPGHDPRDRAGLPKRL
jgi:DeoR/GlpR family transcriptional regulator of sugar metabolism